MIEEQSQNLSNKVINKQAWSLVALLSIRFPQTFGPYCTTDEAVRVPMLKIGIHADLNAALPEIHPRIIQRALLMHTTTEAYQASCVENVARVDLEGAVTGYVTADVAAQAANALNRRAQ